MHPILTFVHITDTHLGPTRDFEFYGCQPARHLRRLVDEINAFPVQPDFVVHTGDVVNDWSAESYAIAQEILGDLSAPLALVNGNHDDPALLRKFFQVPFLLDSNRRADLSADPGAPLDYAFVVNGERFVVLDAHNPQYVRDPLGHLRPAQLDWLRFEAAPDGPPLTVLLHYPPFAMNSPWLNANMPLINGEALHAALLPSRARLRGVFFGHLHRSCQVVRDGITYTCAGSTVSQYAWRPWDDRPQPDHAFAPAYNVVTYFADSVNVLQYGFPRP
jgi:Icc protein